VGPPYSKPRTARLSAFWVGGAGGKVTVAQASNRSINACS